MVGKEQIDAPIYAAVLEKYWAGNPIKEIAKELQISEVKVRRILITEGEWSSRTSEEICELAENGLNCSQIAEKLMKPVKTIQAYMPYSRGEYNDGEISEKARQSKEFRNRKRIAKEKQVQSGIKEKKTIENDRAMKEKTMKENGFAEWKGNAGFSGSGHKILKLHLELQTDLDDEEEATLRKYGKSEEGISRDILIPEGMMLHNLHYAIQRAFGWQNCHLHNFAYPENVFKKLTEEKLIKWMNLCGLYFRFPDGENEDLYWDDDYDESVSPKTWLRRKYSRPYNYGGITEHYMYAQTQAKAFKQQNPMLRIGPSFEEFMAGNKDSRLKKIDDITIREIETYFEYSMGELLERLPVSEVIGLKETENWKKKVKEIADKADKSFPENYRRLAVVRKDRKKMKVLCKETDPTVIPLSDSLLYSYDYGDGWEVGITCTEIYECSDEATDSKGHAVGEKLQDQIAAVIAKGKPVCIAADGLPVLDDVGGPSGYCALLNGIHGQDCDGYPYEDKESSMEWARNMGWNGRMNTPEKLL